MVKGSIGQHPKQAKHKIKTFLKSWTLEDMEKGCSGHQFCRVAKDLDINLLGIIILCNDPHLPNNFFFSCNVTVRSHGLYFTGHYNQAFRLLMNMLSIRMISC